MSEVETQEAGAQVQEEQAATQETTKAKTKVQHTGDFILDTATEVTNLSKTKALNEALKLAKNLDENSFRLGGLLVQIQTEKWFDGYPNMNAFVMETFGFKGRKAEYLMSIYRHLVDKQIPWDIISHLGWTKLKDLAPVLTVDNMNDWATKAADPVTVSQLQAMLKADPSKGDTVKPKTDVVSKNFKLHPEQAEIVNTALAKAKGEGNTDFDNVGLALICSGYLAGASGIPVAEAGPNLNFSGLDFKEVLGAFEKAYPGINLDVDVTEGATQVAA